MPIAVGLQPKALSSTADSTLDTQQQHIPRWTASHTANLMGALYNMTQQHPVQAQVYASLALASPRAGLLWARLVEKQPALPYLLALQQDFCIYVVS